MLILVQFPDIFTIAPSPKMQIFTTYKGQQSQDRQKENTTARSEYSKTRKYRFQLKQNFAFEHLKLHLVMNMGQNTNLVKSTHDGKSHIKS